MTPTDELKPCPMCASSAAVCTRYYGESKKAIKVKFVECTNCWLQTSGKSNVDEVIAAWNRRCDTKSEHVTQNETQGLCNVDSQNPEVSVEVKLNNKQEK